MCFLSEVPATVRFGEYLTLQLPLILYNVNYHVCSVSFLTNSVYGQTRV